MRKSKTKKQNKKQTKHTERAEKYQIKTSNNVAIGCNRLRNTRTSLKHRSI